MPNKSKRWIAALVGACAVGLAAIAAIVLPGGAHATAKSQIRPFSAIMLPSDVQAALTRAAAREGVKADEIREVAAQGEGKVRAGMYVGSNAQGKERVSFFAPQSFSTFAKTERLAPASSPLFVSTSAQPDIPGGATGHVQLGGVAHPTVSRVEITRADGSEISADLVDVIVGGYAFFTYTSNDPTTFPTVVRAFDAKGLQVAAQDVTAATKPPATG